MTYHKLSGLVVLAVGCLAATMVRAELLTYEVVPGDSSVTFQTAAVRRIIGGTSELSGTIVVDADHPGDSAHARIEIAATGLKSGNRRRDAHMHERALHSSEYPKIVLDTTGVSTDAAELTEGSTVVLNISATLELHGQTKSLSFPVSLTRVGSTLTLDGETSLLMTDYGITRPRFLLLIVRDLTKIRFHIVAKHAPSVGMTAR